MPTELILTKSAYAAHRGVKAHTVSSWIARRKLSGAALTGDGRIAVAEADRQLGGTVDPVISASARQRLAAAASPTAPAAEIVDIGPARDLLRARALSASVDAERKRRELNQERGKYMLTGEAERDWASILGDLVQGIEIGLTVDLPIALGLDRKQVNEVRRWWRSLRQRLSDEQSAAAERKPEFTADPAHR